jgi:hypothetical protein
MAKDQSLNEILGVDLSQEDTSISSENTSFMTQQSRQKYTVDTVEAPKDYIEKLNKLLEAADIAGSIVKTGKINYYTAESLFSIYPFISETDVSRTTKNMSTINYDSIRKTMLSNLKTYTESLIDELDEKWQSYQDSHYEIVNSDMIERTLNSLHAFSIENKDALEELVTFSYARKFKVAKSNMQGEEEGEEVFFKFSELNESNIKDYESTLSQDTYFNFIITNYSYYESNQLTFNNLLNQLNWINESINVCFKLYSAIGVGYSPNPLVAVMTVFHKLSNLTNSDLDKLIKFVRDVSFKRHDELKVLHTSARQDLRLFADDADNFAKLIDNKNYFFEYLNKLTNAINYLRDIKFIYTYAVKNKQLLDDLKSTLNNFKRMFD